MILFKNALYLGKTAAFAARIEIIVRITATRGDVSSSLRKT